MCVKFSKLIFDDMWILHDFGGGRENAQSGLAVPARNSNLLTATGPWLIKSAQTVTYEILYVIWNLFPIPHEQEGRPVIRMGPGRATPGLCVLGFNVLADFGESPIWRRIGPDLF